VQQSEPVQSVEAEVVSGEGSGAKVKKNRGRPFKKSREGGESIVLLEDGDDIGVDGVVNRPKNTDLSDSENYESEDLNSGCGSDGEDGEARKKFPTFKMPKKDVWLQLGAWYLFSIKEGFPRWYENIWCALRKEN